MGTRAHWYRSRWRYRVDGDSGWTYADLLSDLSALPDTIEIQKRVRVGRKGDATYAPWTRRRKCKEEA